MAKKKQKSAKKSENKEKNGKLSKKQIRQLIYIVIGMGLLFLALIVIYAIQNSNNHFTFLGLNWDRQKFGEILVYHSQIQAVSSSGNSLFDLYIRNDPRSLNLPNETIRFMKDTVYLSIDESIGECKEGTVAFTDLGKFLAALKIPAKMGLTNKSEAENSNLPFITCANSLTSTVFIFKGANETQVIKEGNCYIVEVADCEIIKAAESIMVGTISK